MLFSHAFVRQCHMIRNARLASTVAGELKPTTRRRAITTKLLLDEAATAQGGDGKRKRRSTSKDKATKVTAVKVKLPPRIQAVAKVQEHYDLKSYLQWGEQHGKNPDTTVYRGTVYEYRVGESLSEYGFELRRSGQKGDKGIDWIGVWKLPNEADIKVLISCKLSKPKPVFLRELADRTGAPAGWNDKSVMSFLVSAHPPSRGMLKTMERSDLPMGFIQISSHGPPIIFAWNSVAGTSSLAGLTSTTLYNETAEDVRSGEQSIGKKVSLSWQNKKLGS